jgi:flavodoxin
MFTEVYRLQNGSWKLGSLSYRCCLAISLAFNVIRKLIDFCIMKNVFLLFAMMGLCSSWSCSTAQSTSSKKNLIVYLSRTNNTKAIAQLIHKYAGGDLVALELVTPYPANYGATVQQVVRENESGYLPPLKTKIDSIHSYGIVFVGFPTWGMKLPPPMKSFLKQYDLRAKTIVPFNTNDGYGIGSSFDTVKELCPNSKVLEGFTIQGGVDTDGTARLTRDENLKDAERKVNDWLKKIQIVKQKS